MSGLPAAFRSTNLRGAFASSSSSSSSKKSGTKLRKSPMKKDIKPFPFFNLPRELRDRVYRIALVTRLIDIELVACGSDDDDEETLAMHPQPRYRTTYTSMGKKMTYRLQPPRDCQCGACPSDPEPQLQLFYVNRTVYAEARDVFYKENEFNVHLASGLGCSAFLKDREYALRYIRNLSFDIPLHTADFSYGRWTDKTYKALFKTIKEKTGLRHLNLNFHGLVPDVSANKWRCPCDCQEFEHPLLQLGQVMGMPGVPISRTVKVHNREWDLIKAFAAISDLQRLSINIDFCYHMLDHDDHDDEVFEYDHIRNFIAYMRSRMLKKGDMLGTTQIHGYCRVQDEVDDKRYRFHSDDDEYGKSHLAIIKAGHNKTARHDHMDSGSEQDHDDIPELDMTDEDEWEDEDDDGEYDSEDDSDDDMPSLESSSEDEEMPSLEDLD